MSIWNASVNSYHYFFYFREIEANCLFQYSYAVVEVKAAVGRWEHGLGAKVGIEGAIPKKHVVKPGTSREYAVAHQKHRPKEFVLYQKLHIQLKVVLFGYKPVFQDYGLGYRLHKEKGALGIDALPLVTVDTGYHQNYKSQK